MKHLCRAECYLHIQGARERAELPMQSEVEVTVCSLDTGISFFAARKHQKMAWFVQMHAWK